jgi:hypothetical protein
VALAQLQIDGFALDGIAARRRARALQSDQHTRNAGR